MVRSAKEDSRRKPEKQGEDCAFAGATKIGPGTSYGYTEDRLTPYGGLLPLEKLLDGLKFRELFHSYYPEPKRQTHYGSYFFIKGLLLLLFIGFRRIYHFFYVREDSLLLGLLGVSKLPDMSTFWRYLHSVGINQAGAMVRLMAALRERAWQTLNLELRRVHVDIDTTVETVYGQIQGARKGHNPKARGKKGLRPVLAFLAETKEYLSGKLRRGETIGGEETAKFIAGLPSLLPGSVRQVTVRADAEFFSWEAVHACFEAGFGFILAVKRAAVPFEANRWYSLNNKTGVQYNQCDYQPAGWEFACRFVAMRIPKEAAPEGGQESLFEDDHYKYRIFVTNLSKTPHSTIAEYDLRAGAENLVGEAKREGLAAIPSKNFHSNMAYFQIVMLAYNLWRYLKLLSHPDTPEPSVLNTIHVSRLKLLFLAAKLVTHSNRTMLKYGCPPERRPLLDRLFSKVNHLRNHPEIWASPIVWQNRCQPIMQKISCMNC